MTNNQLPERQQILLAEHAACLEQAKYLASIIWQTAAVFLNLSLVGLAYVARTTVDGDPESLLSIVAIAGGSIAMLLAWFGLFRRWDSYLKVAYIRMVEIEEGLGMYMARYGKYLRDSKLGTNIPEEMNSETDLQFVRVREESLLQQFYARSQHEIMRRIVMFLIAGWIVVVIFKIGICHL